MFIANATFNNMGQPFLSTLTNWGRNALALIPLVWIGAYLFDAQGVLIGQSLAVHRLVLWRGYWRCGVSRGAVPDRAKG